MAGIELIDQIVPKNSQDFGMVEDIHFIGGFRVVATIVERDAIVVNAKEKEGCIAYVLDSDGLGTPEYYQWDGAAWIIWTFGTGNVTGPATSTDNAIARYDGVTGQVIQDSSVTISDAGDLQMLNDANILPDSAGSGEVGTDLLPWRRIRANEIVSGDLLMESEERNARWRFIEHHGCIQVINEITGQHYKLALVDSDPKDFE